MPYTHADIFFLYGMQEVGNVAIVQDIKNYILFEYCFSGKVETLKSINVTFT